MRKLSLLLILSILTSAGIGQVVKEYKIDKQYLNFPIDMQKNRQMVQFVLENDTLTYNVIRIADNEPDYWVFKDVSAYKGKTLKLIFAENSYGLDKIYQSDEINGVQTPQLNPGKLVFDIEMLIDRTSVESFINKGQIVFVKPLEAAKKEIGLVFHGNETEVKVNDFKVYELKTAW